MESKFSDSAFSFKVEAKNITQQEQGQPDSVKVKSQSVSTNEIYYRDAHIGTMKTQHNIEVQTEKYSQNISKVRKPQNEDDEYYDEEEDNQNEENQAIMLKALESVNIGRLESWLDKVYPKVLQVLESNISIKAYDQYEVLWEDEREDINEAYCLRTDFDFKEANKAVQKTLHKLGEGSDLAQKKQDDNFDDWGDDKKSKQKQSKKQEPVVASEDQLLGLDNDYQVSSLAWNSNGSSLAVAYGKTNHIAWCEHLSVLCIWSIFRRDVNSKKPTTTIEVSNCLTQVAFHPTDPVILAGGTMNGEIYLWNVSAEEPQIAVSAIDEYFHREAITKLVWVRQESLTTLAVRVSLISTSTDGKILVWRYGDQLRYPIKGHLLAAKKNQESSITGGTALDKVNQMEDNTYLVGTEGGSIFKCSIAPPSDSDISHMFQDNSNLRWKNEALAVLANLTPKHINEVKKKVERYAQDKGLREVQVQTIFDAKPDIKLLFPSPFTANYEKHMGVVTGVNCSPFLKRLFLTCSVDGAVRMYDVFFNRPVAVFEPGYNEYLQSVIWSPFRPTVFVTVSNNGTVYIYDLLLSKQTPSYVLQYNQSLVSSDVVSSQKTAYCLSFNPRQRDFLAVGYHDGTCKIFQLNYSLSTQKNDELKLLKQSFLEKKGSE